MGFFFVYRRIYVPEVTMTDFSESITTAATTVGDIMHDMTVRLSRRHRRRDVMYLSMNQIDRLREGGEHLILSEYRPTASWQAIDNPSSIEEINQWHDAQIERYTSGEAAICGQCGNPVEITENTKLYIGIEFDGPRSIFFIGIPVCDSCVEANEFFSEAVACDSCGLLMCNALHVTNSEGEEKAICIHCYNFMDELSKCKSCGQIGFSDTYHDAINRRSGETDRLCSSCYESVGVCPNCNSYKGVDVWTYKTITDGKAEEIGACSYCNGRPALKLTRCSLCSEMWDAKDIITVNGPQAIFACPVCEKAIKRTCSVCGGLNGTKHNLCAACQTGNLHEWNYKPDVFIFHGKKAGPFYGIELEITGFPNPRKREKRLSGKKLKCALDLHSISSNEEEFYLMVDSTTDGGFEVVFHPRTYKNWLVEGKELLANVIEIARKYGAVSYKGGSCGVHIHRSVKDIPTTLGILKLMYGLQAIEPFAFIIAQRTGVSNKMSCETGALEVGSYGGFSRIKKWFPDNGVGGFNAKKLLKMKDRWLHDIADDHHAAITFGVGKDTIELRIFRGTLVLDTILAYLSFYDLLTDWSQQADLDKLMRWQNATSWKNFGHFIRSKDTEAASRLIEYVKEKGVLL